MGASWRLEPNEGCEPKQSYRKLGGFCFPAINSVSVHQTRLQTSRKIVRSSVKVVFGPLRAPKLLPPKLKTASGQNSLQSGDHRFSEICQTLVDGKNFLYVYKSFSVSGRSERIINSSLNTK